jgi:hypothetical protein
MLTQGTWPARLRAAFGVPFNDKSIMNKRQLIDDIRRLNTTARPQFLGQFDEAALRQYLQHLEDAQAKRVRIAGWVRRSPKLHISAPDLRVAG